MSTENQRISIVIVSYNSGHILGDCLQQLPANAEIIVVDNASSDDSGAIASEHNARVISLPENVGYGCGCNVGARASSGEFILFLNPDVRFEPDAITKLIDAANRYRSAAALTPRLIEADGSIFFRDSSIISPAPHNSNKPKWSLGGDCSVDTLSGAAMFCRRDAFLSVGGFDEKIFLYYEDDDICRRLREAGWSLVYVYDAVAGHEHGTSTRPKKGSEFFRSFHWAI